ncbi:MAG: hypothetical protein ACKV2O_11905 [Acidimicrobiales bacterium]
MTATTERAREGVEIGVGLALLGAQRWLSLRPGIERELERLGHYRAAGASRWAGRTLAEALQRSLSPK